MGTADIQRFSQPPYFEVGLGVRTPWGFVLSPGARIAAIVSSGGVQDLDEDPFDAEMVTTLAQGLARCRSGMGDVVLVRGNHAENVSATGGLANLVAGTKIIGLADPSTGLGPKFTWTADVTWAVSVANVTMQGLNLQMNGANDITVGITVTGANFRLLGCNINTGTGAALDCVTGISVSAAASGFVMAGCKSRQSGGTTASLVTIGAADDARVCDNDLQIIGAAATSVLVGVTAAATNLRIERNTCCQYHAASTTTIAFSNHASTGIVADNRSAILADGVAASTGITFGAASLVRPFNNLTCDEPQASGVLSPAGCAT